MVPRFTLRLVELHFDPAHQPGKQEGTLNLGAGDRHLVAQGSKIGAGYRERETVSVPFDESRSHGGEWDGDPPHGTAAERAVSRERDWKVVARQDSQKETGGCARVPAVEHTRRV